MSLPGRFLSIGGQRVFCHRTGHGRPLVLVHGYVMSHWCWRHVIPGLSTDHDVIAIDLPGFGESDRPPPTEYRYDAGAFMETVLGVLDVLGLERATLVGHSLGGGVVLHTAARRPERVERVVAVDPLCYPYAMPPEGLVLTLPYVGLTLFRTFYTRGVVRRYLQRHIYRDPALADDDWVDFIWERLNRPGGMAAAHAALRLCQDPVVIERSVRAVRAPTLIVWGDADPLFPVEHAARLQADIAGSELAIIPACGHAPAEERPEETLRALRAFLGPARAARPAAAAVPS